MHNFEFRISNFEFFSGGYCLWMLTMVLLAVLGLTGCSGFLGQRVGDFRAYYNTFYNAERAFDNAVRAFEAREERIDQAAYLTLFPGPESAPVREELRKAIEKSADVLRKYPRSRWVDDALMLIGKSYFYQANFVGAERKFREVLALAEGPKQEARFWLARTLLAAGKPDEAASFLREQLDEVAKDPRLRLLLGALHVRQKAWPEAVTALRQGVERVEDDRLAARAYFLVGQVLETMDRYAEAATAYDRAAALHPGYELHYAAQVGAVRALSGAERGAEALDRLNALLSDDKNADRRAELLLLRGRLYQTLGRAGAARHAYTQLLYGGNVEPASVRGRVHYALGTLYRDAYRKYVRAAAHFDTAATALAPPSDPLALTPLAITNSQALAESFGTLAGVTQRVRRLDSLLHLGSLNEEDFQAFVQELRRQRARELAATARARAERTADAGFETTRLLTEGGSQQELATTSAESEVGFLFHRNPARVQEARAAFFRQWGRRPHVRNWRRLNAVSAAAGSTAAGAGAEGEAAAPGVLAEGPVPVAGLPQVDVSAVPRDSVSRAAMHAERARARYELGNTLFLVVGLADSAAFWYRQVIEEQPDAPVARRARYALAEVARARGDTSLARRRYHRLIEQYPASVLAVQAREQLRTATPDASLRDAPGRAERAYAEAYDRWQRGHYAGAVERFLAVAARYRMTAVAPRALLAAGRAALEWTRRDTLGFGDPLPVVLPDSLFEPGGLLAFPRDSLGASNGRDTLRAARLPPDTPAADTTQALPAADTTQALPAADTTQASSYLPSDAMQARADTLDTLITFDSLFTARNAAVSRDTIAVRPRHRLRAEVLFAGLVAHYPETPEAARARLVLPLLREHAAVDSLRPGPLAPDSLLARSGTRFAVSDTVAALDSTALRSVSIDSTALFGRAPLNPEGEGWTIVVASGRERAGAETVAERFRRQGYRAGVLITRSTEDTRYFAAVGQFETRAVARAAFNRYAHALPDSSRLLQLPVQRN